MKKIVFLVHDPGGYDVVFPVVQCFQQQCIPIEFYCVGPAAKLNPLYGISELEVLQVTQAMLQDKTILGLITGTSWGTNMELKAIVACKEAQIPTISILDYWSNYRARFQEEIGNFIYPDYLIIMDELAEQEAVQSGVPSNILKVLGHPGLDKYTTSPKKQSRFDEKQKKILFLSQPLSALYGEELGYTEQQALEECIRAVHENDNYSLYIKFHPKDATEFKQQYSNIIVEGYLQEIMPEYDLIIGMNTMGLLHAVLMGIPAISYQPNLRQSDMCITNKLGLTRLIHSYQELQIILHDVAGEMIPNINLSQKIPWLDGRSTERVAVFIREVLLNEI